MLFEERSHQLIGFFGFGERGIVPERVGQRFENDELRVNSGLGDKHDGESSCNRFAVACISFRKTAKLLG
jgi:hypothetical protein